MKASALVAMIITEILLAGFVFGEIDVITKEIYFSPENQPGDVVRIEVNCSSPENNVFFLIRNDHGVLVACLLRTLAAGENTVEWNGKDAYGKLIPKGRYQVYLSRNIEWKLDKTFGMDGRIGRFMFEDVIKDPEKAEFKVPGELISVRVNNEKLYDIAFHKADEDWAEGKNYLYRDGMLTLNPMAGLKKGDRVRVDFCFPIFFQNPWDMDIDSQGNLWVISHWHDPDSSYVWGRLIKLFPNGDKLDEKFGSQGQIPKFCRSNNQIIISESEKRIYIGGSDLDAYGTGVFDFDTGARLYFIGGYFPGTEKTTYAVSGICLGGQNKIYIRSLGSTVFAYDRNKGTKNPDENGYMYSSMPTGKNDALPPIYGVYWGPSLASSAENNMFYMTAWNSTLYKVIDTGEKFRVLYSLVISDSDPIGMSFSPELNLLFVALRSSPGEISVIYDSGSSLKEVMRLKDPELGGVHTVKWHKGFLYVLEDGDEIPEGYVTKKLREKGYSDIIQGNNRISRYSVGFQKETMVCTIVRE